MNRKLINSQLSNFSIYQMYKRQLLTLAENVFEFTNMPKFIDTAYLNKVLLRQGSIAFFVDEVMGLLALPYQNIGNLDVYGRPTSIQVTSLSGYTKLIKNSDDFVIMYDNNGRYPLWLDILQYAERIALDTKTSIINIAQQKTPRFWKTKTENLKSIQDLAISINNTYMPCYDNLDIISSEKSDLLCIASTGGVYPKRKLYTNDEESMMALKSNIILNGVNVVAIKPDLLDRCTLLTLERISEGERIEERILWSNFNKDKPKILGAILTTLSKAKRIYPTLKLTKLGRMADFTVWGYAVAEALEIGGEEFLKAYLNNQKKANQEAVESNPVATALIKYMDENKEFTGTVSTLLKILNQVAEAEQIDTKSKLWAKEPNVLSRRLNEMKSNLELEGIYYEITQRNHGRIIDIVKIPKEKVA